MPAGLQAYSKIPVSTLVPPDAIAAYGALVAIGFLSSACSPCPGILPSTSAETANIRARRSVGPQRRILITCFDTARRSFNRAGQFVCRRISA